MKSEFNIYEIDQKLCDTYYKFITNARIVPDGNRDFFIEGLFIGHFIAEQYNNVNYCIVKNLLTNKHEIFLNLYTKKIKEIEDMVTLKAVPKIRFFVENEKIYYEFLTNKQISGMYLFKKDLYKIMHMNRVKNGKDDIITDLYFIQQTLSKNLKLNLTEEKTVDR